MKSQSEKNSATRGILEKKPVLVIGGNGKTGSRVISRLQQLSWPVTGASRSTPLKFDWYDQLTWAPALKGMNSVYVTYQPDIAIPGSTDAIRELSALAKKAGVKKLVLLSGRGEAEALAAEKIVMNAGLDWTIVRASWFDQNFNEGFLLDQLMSGVVELPAGDMGEPFVDVDDIADVVFASLTEEGHSGEIYEVTGPRLLTFEQAIDSIAKATGRSIQYKQISVDEYAAALRSLKIQEEFVWFITYLFTEVLDGRNESTTDGVERALGRKPTDFSDYVKKAIAAGSWK